MGIREFTVLVPAQIGVNPRRVRLVTTDTLGTITTAGYLNSAILETGQPLYRTDIVDCIYSATTQPLAGTYGQFTVGIANGVVTLTQTAGGATLANVVQTNAVNTMAAGSDIALAKGTGTATGNAVTINQQAGLITTVALTTAAGAATTIALTNSFILAGSLIQPSWNGGTNTVATISLEAVVTGAGTANIIINNIGPTAALAGTMVIGFTIF